MTSIFDHVRIVTIASKENAPAISNHTMIISYMRPHHLNAQCTMYVLRT